MNEAQGKKEVCEAVLIAAINAAAAALITFGVEELKKYLAEKRKKPEPEPVQSAKKKSTAEPSVTS